MNRRMDFIITFTWHSLIIYAWFCKDFMSIEIFGHDQFNIHYISSKQGEATAEESNEIEGFFTRIQRDRCSYNFVTVFVVIWSCSCESFMSIEIPGHEIFIIHYTPTRRGRARSKQIQWKPRWLLENNEKYFFITLTQ